MGCLPAGDASSAGHVRLVREPGYNAPYHLYTPGSYTATRPCALLILCHASGPLDGAAAEIERWRASADQHGFIVAAPELAGTSGLPPSHEHKVADLQQNERVVLSVVKAVRSSQAIDPTRIFMAGLRQGCNVALFAGLRHADVFRALAVQQADPDLDLLEPCTPFVDPYQRVQVLFESTDAGKHKSQSCIDWLRTHGMDPVILQRAGFHHNDAQPIVEFFIQTVRQHPFIRIDVEDDAQDAMRLSFRVRASFEPQGYQWDFGDQQGATGPAPSHTYAQAGLYNLRVALWAPGGKRYIRPLRLQVPRMRLGTARPATPTD